MGNNGFTDTQSKNKSAAEINYEVNNLTESEKKFYSNKILCF